MAVSVDCGKVGRGGGGDLVEEEDWDKDESMDWDHVTLRLDNLLLSMGVGERRFLGKIGLERVV